MKSKIILTPGPVRVPTFVIEAISKPVIHHRSPEFEFFFKELQEGLRYFFQTSHTVISLSGTGTHGVEYAMRSLFRKNEKVLIPSFGKFSERWVEYGKSSGLNVTEIQKPYGSRVNVKEILDVLDRNPGITGMVLTHCETSTGATLDLEEIVSEVKRKYKNVLIMVDAITTLGIIPFYSDAWGADSVIAASQKSLLNPAGTVFVSVGPAAASRLSETRMQDAFDLSCYYFAAMQNAYPYTPPTQLLYGIKAALDCFQEKKLPFFWNRTHSLARFFREGISAAGGKIFPDPAGDSLTAFLFSGKDLKEIYTKLKDELSIEIAEGQGELKGKILRVAHFGDIGMEETKLCLGGISEIIQN